MDEAHKLSCRNPKPSSKGRKGSTHHGTEADGAGGRSVRPHPGRHRLCRGRAPSERPQARHAPTPSTGEKPGGGIHRPPAASPSPAGPCSRGGGKGSQPHQFPPFLPISPCRFIESRDEEGTGQSPRTRWTSCCSSQLRAHLPPGLHAKPFLGAPRAQDERRMFAKNKKE